MLRCMGTRSAVFARFDAAEYRLCRRLNRAADRSVVRGYFRFVSRLGDGVVWYAMLALLPLVYGAAAVRPAIAMAAVGLIGVGVYKLLKHVFVRERPFITHPAISLAAAPLDRYSFPSGHTLHAVAFTWQGIAHFPELVWLLVPLAASIAMSRVVLGLHYPTDVAVGAMIGAALGALGLALA